MMTRMLMMPLLRRHLLVLVFVLLLVADLRCTSTTPPEEEACVGGAVISNSNRNDANPCSGTMGDECAYVCDPGYVHSGRHVCQTYGANGHTVANHSFYGGSCNRLCAGNGTAAQCQEDLAPLRTNSTDTRGACLMTSCLPANDLFMHIAKSNYALWQMGRNNRTGIYLDHVDMFSAPANQTWSQGGVGMSGLGVVMECIADALGWAPREEVAAKVLATLRAFSGNLPGVHIPRHASGWLPRFVDSNSGTEATRVGPLRHLDPSGSFSTLSTGLLTAGCLFAMTYFNNTHPLAPETKEIVDLAMGIYKRVKWETLLCNTELVTDPVSGTGIPMVINETVGCISTEFPESDGYYSFYENHYTVWLTYEAVCGKQVREGRNCTNSAVSAMWDRWQGRRLHPNEQFQGHPLLPYWSCYIPHLSFYLVHPFNSDEVYQHLFSSHWLADWAYYNTSAYYGGDRGRYGLGAGPTEEWCAGTSYLADQIHPSGGEKHAGCRDFSPYCVAGYLPADPTVVQEHLLALMSDGDVVYQIPGTGHHVLWRRSMVDRSWSQGYGVTLVDFSSELLGLATIWLGKDFFIEHTNHFSASPRAA